MFVNPTSASPEVGQTGQNLTRSRSKFLHGLSRKVSIVLLRLLCVRSILPVMGIGKHRAREATSSVPRCINSTYHYSYSHLRLVLKIKSPQSESVLRICFADTLSKLIHRETFYQTYFLVEDNARWFTRVHVVEEKLFL